MRKETINNLENEGFWITLENLIRDNTNESSNEAIILLTELQNYFYFNEKDITNIVSTLKKETKL